MVKHTRLVSNGSKKRVQIVLGKPVRMKWTIFKGDRLSPAELKRIADTAARARVLI